MDNDVSILFFTFLQSCFIDLYVDFEQDKNSHTRNPSFLNDGCTYQSFIVVENEIFLLHTNRGSILIQTTFRPTLKVTL